MHDSLGKTYIVKTIHGSALHNGHFTCETRRAIEHLRSLLQHVNVIKQNVMYRGSSYEVHIPADTFVLPLQPYLGECDDTEQECSEYSAIQYKTTKINAITLEDYVKLRNANIIPHKLLTPYDHPTNYVYGPWTNVTFDDFLKIQLLAIVTWLHSNKLRHRDLHNKNVLVNVSTERVYIIDWDLLQLDDGSMQTPETGCTSSEKQWHKMLATQEDFPLNCVGALFLEGGRLACPGKQYIVYNGYRYLVRKDGRKQFIVHKKSVVYLSAIRGQYTRVKP